MYWSNIGIYWARYKKYPLGGINLIKLDDLVKSKIKPSKHYFSMLMLITLKKNLLNNHYKVLDQYRYKFYFKGDIFGVLVNGIDFSIKVFYKGACIQYFSTLEDFDSWMINGCTKETLLMKSKKESS